ncbi:unnamed protein product [Adineta ricciae]|uniref:Uncharacterized protein n=1 Tax=Adineta ricciae TaxID=249248 RepID=A0A814HYL2_ADIRI|nr:unnamed protein product [Adineta ricciae]
MQMIDASTKPPDIRHSSSSDQNVLNDDLPPLDVLREMIKYETFLRLSEPIQNLFDFYRKDDSAITMVLDSVQQHVVERFGYKHVNSLRTAVSRFPDDPVIKEAFYIKHNKITQGLVYQGQVARDVDLFTVDGQPTTLFSQITSGQPLIILAANK